LTSDQVTKQLNLTKQQNTIGLVGYVVHSAEVF